MHETWYAVNYQRYVETAQAISRSIAQNLVVAAFPRPVFKAAGVSAFYTH